jgi:hypothetical protein
MFKTTKLEKILWTLVTLFVIVCVLTNVRIQQGASVPSKVCTVSDKFSDNGIPMISTYECGEMAIQDLNYYNQIRVGSTYKFDFCEGKDEIDYLCGLQEVIMYEDQSKKVVNHPVSTDTLFLKPNPVLIKPDTKKVNNKTIINSEVHDGGTLNIYLNK